MAPHFPFQSATQFFFFKKFLLSPFTPYVCRVRFILGQKRNLPCLRSALCFHTGVEKLLPIKTMEGCS